MLLNSWRCQRTPLHPNVLVRDRRNIIQEMQCSTVEVTSNPEYQRHNKCSKEYLPMYLGEEPVYLNTSKADHKITNSWSTRLWWSITIYIGGHQWKLGPRRWSSSIHIIPVVKTKPEQLEYHVDELDHVDAVDATNTVESGDLEQSDRKQGLSRRSPAVWSAEWLAETTSSPAESRGSDELLRDSLTWGMWIGLEVLPVGRLGSVGHCSGFDVVLYLIGKLSYMVMSVNMICGEESHEPGLSGSTRSYWRSSEAAWSKPSMNKREEPWLNLIMELNGRVKSRSDLSGDDDDLISLAIHASGGFCCTLDWTRKGWTVP